MKKKILKFFGLALYSELKHAQDLTNLLLDRIEIGREFLVLKEGEEMIYQNINTDLIIRNQNNVVDGNNINGAVFIFTDVYGNADGLVFRNNRVEGDFSPFLNSKPIY